VGRLRPLLLTLAPALLGLAIWAPAAGATFHLMQIREVYPGSLANPGSEYVELQMWAEDQNHVAGHLLRTYDAAGTVTGSDAFPADVPRGADQSTMVLATPEAEAEFGFTADAALTPSGRLDPAGGAVCWESIDCVSWGSFAGSLPSPAGSPAAPAGIPDGMALRRTIAPGCATLLESLDDRDNSAADYPPACPAPPPNSVAPAERACQGAGGGVGGGAGGGPSQATPGAPDTSLRHGPPKRSWDRTPSFRFGADEPGAGFECRLDARPFRACRSPFTAPPLATGPHRFRVRAEDDSGAVDPSPASYRFRVLPRR
jgi:hypothetical protein